MYPQQQQHHAPPFVTNLQQQQQTYYSANPYLWSFPVTSDSAIHPPGTDPFGNSATPFPVAAASSAYGAQTTDSQNWIVKQAEPIKYDIAVGSSHETSAASTSLPSAWNATWPQQYSTSDTTVMLPNKTKVTTTPMRCEVCKIDCNSKDVYEKHILGKKHKRNSQVGLVSGNGIGPCITGFKRHGIGFQKKAPNKIKVAQSAWCEVCKINCNSRDMYIAHLAGKKHLKNMVKLSKPKIHEVISATTAEELSKPKIHEVIGATTAEELSKPKIHEVINATTGNALQHAAIPMIGPQEKPDANKPKPMKAPKKTKPKKALEMDIEAKKRKVVEGGAAEGDVRLCSLCNVVCNSQTVFNDHLTGHKHAAMVKKAGSSAG